MRKSFLMRFLVVAVWSSAAWAQGVQNFDMYIGGGPAWSRSRTIGGTDVKLASTWGGSYEWGLGYQIVRASAASLWVDYSFAFSFGEAVKANVRASGSYAVHPMTLGLRFMVPVNARLSFYGLSSGGFGSFHSPELIGGDNPSVTTRFTTHGVFAFGGGADVRLSTRFSLRAEVRDFVSGKELAGAAGRHHLLPVIGVAFHH